MSPQSYSLRELCADERMKAMISLVKKRTTDNQNKISSNSRTINMRILLTFVFLSASILASAQFIQKGSVVGSGGLSFRSYSIEELSEKSTEFGINISGGYAVLPNLVVGITPQVTTIRSTTAAGNAAGVIANTYSTDIWSIGPLVKYYFNPGIFIYSNYQIGKSKTRQEIAGNGPYDYKSDTKEITLGAGYAIKVGKRILLEPQVGYFHSEIKPESTFSQTKSGMYFSVGFSFIIYSPQE